MLQLAALFSDHAILQRDQPVPVWGWGPPHTRVQVTLGPHTAHGYTSARSRFLVWLPPLPAGGPHTLAVTAPSLPALPSVTARNLLVGEVWLASGQSNMQWTLSQCGPEGDAAITSAEDPALRVFSVSRQANLGPQDDVTGDWQPASPASAQDFSAVAFHFAQKLRRELDLPVGVIVSAWGGTKIEHWLSRRALLAHPDTARATADYDLSAHSTERWGKLDPANPSAPINALPSDPGPAPESATWSAPDFDDHAWPVMPLPSTWQKHGHAFSGVFWFRKTIDLPAAWLGRHLELHLGAADKHDTAWVNGTLVGRTGENFDDRHWNRPRVYPVPSSSLARPRAVIAVRVYSFLYDGGLIGPAEHMRLVCPSRPDDPPVPLTGDWRHAVERDFGIVLSSELSGHLAGKSPHMLHDNMLAPLAPFALRGALWYQGESNTDRPVLYADLLRNLATEWRDLWARPDLPFYIVQLPLHHAPAAFDPDSAWARLRSSQLEAARAHPASDLAITLDLGEADDIHPQNKQPVGHRLAQLALTQTYGRPGVPSGPLPLAATQNNSTVTVTFERTAAGLITTDGQPPRPVFLRDAPGIWHEATARLDGHQLVASAPTCSSPVELAYAWADHPAGANLANHKGFPATPFRLAVC